MTDSVGGGRSEEPCTEPNCAIVSSLGGCGEGVLVGEGLLRALPPPLREREPIGEGDPWPVLSLALLVLFFAEKLVVGILESPWDMSCRKYVSLVALRTLSPESGLAL